MPSAAPTRCCCPGSQGITDLITTPGVINLDFADVKAIMANAGSALMGIGRARGEDRAVVAAEQAISSPLLEASMDGAHGVLMNISGGSDLGLFEINASAELVAEAAHPEANIIFGTVIDDALGDEVRITVIAAGFDGAPERRPTRGHGGRRLTIDRQGGGQQLVRDLRDPAPEPAYPSERPAARAGATSFDRVGDAPRCASRDPMARAKVSRLSSPPVRPHRRRLPRHRLRKPPAGASSSMNSRISTSLTSSSSPGVGL